MDDDAEDYGFQKGRGACGRSTWSDRSDNNVFDCGCGAGIHLAEELEAQELEPPDFPDLPAEDEPEDYTLRVNGERIPPSHLQRAEPIHAIRERFSPEVA